MVSTATFPNANINLQDLETNVVPDPTILPLHIPMFMCFTDTGPVGVPTLGGTNALTTMFGPSMLNQRSPLYHHPNVFLEHALQYQQVYLVRLVDPAAFAASLVVLCTVTPGSLVQYQRTSGGALVLDTSGNPIPIVAEGGGSESQPGVTLTFSTRPLATSTVSNTVDGVTTITTVNSETIRDIATTTVMTEGVSAVTYPLLAIQAPIGSAGNLMGFSLFYNSLFDASAVANANAMIYSFNPVTLNGSTSIASPVYDIYNEATQAFAFPANAYDPTTATYYDLVDVVTNDFNGLPGLPYNFSVYGANATAIGQAVLAVSPELGAMSPNLINILSAVDQEGNPYEHAVMGAGSVDIVNPNVVLYLQGGTDGTTTKTMLENLTTQFVSGELNPEISDVFRYPITHLYDSGYSLACKQTLPAIFGLRDDVKIEFSTQDVALPANTAPQDQSTGSALRAALLLNPESIEFGTQACRASIYQQCGLLSDSQTWNTIVPATINRLIKRCIYNGTDHVTGEPKGRPNSEVTILKIGSLNWTPSTPQQMQLSWNTGLNYIQYCDVATLFYADLLSIYPIDTSLLSSDVFVDYVAVYLKHIIRQQWTIFVGRDDPPKSLFQDIAAAIDARASYVFGNIISTSTVVSQTAVDTALGYQSTVTVSVQGSMPNRVWKVIVPITQATA